MFFKSPEGWSLYTEEWSVKTLSDKYKRGEIDFESRVQRPVVWNLLRSSRYIQSLLWGMLAYNIPQLYSKHDNVYDSLDGKQRSMTLIRFVNNEFKLRGLQGAENNIIVNGESISINNKFFRSLPDQAKERILDFMINLVVLEDAPEKVEAEFFERANSGVAVKKEDIAYAKNVYINEIAEMTEHEIFNAMFKQGGKDRQSNKRAVIIKSWIVLNETTPRFETKHFTDLAQTLKISEVEKQQILDAYNMIFQAYKTLLISDAELAKQVLNVTHFLSYLPFVENFKDKNELADWLKKFYTNMPQEYYDASQQATASITMINARNSAIKKSVDEYLGLENLVD